MESLAKLYLERAENELELARVVFLITDDEPLQRNTFHLRSVHTFYSAVITHAYYCMFYAAKAYLLTKDVRLGPPEEHKKVYDAFADFVAQGVVDNELLLHYDTVFSQATSLLGLLHTERRKRAEFTYQRLSQANKLPAQQSLTSASTFFKHLYVLCE